MPTEFKEILTEKLNPQGRLMADSTDQTTPGAAKSPKPREEKGGEKRPGKVYTLNADPGHYAVRGVPVGTLVEGSPESATGRRVDSRPAGGGRSYSTTDRDGTFTLDLSGDLDRGRRSESQVLEFLMQVLQAQGREVRPLIEARDDRGEDRLLSIDGTKVVVQIAGP